MSFSALLFLSDLHVLCAAAQFRICRIYVCREISNIDSKLFNTCQAKSKIQNNTTKGKLLRNKNPLYNNKCLYYVGQAEGNF
jgi:hypothetical protein